VPSGRKPSTATGTLRSMIQALIFDMDGVLVDSELFWRQAEQESFVLAGLHLTEEDCLKTTGLRIDEVVEHWYRQFPWERPSKAEIAEAIIGRVAELIRQEGTLLPGVDAALGFGLALGLRTALATSSPHVVIRAVLETFSLARHFDVIHSAQDEPNGKPHPGVYLTTAARLGVSPEVCVAIEDSPNGVLAARAAGMKCIAVPLPELRDDPRLRSADVILEGLGQLDAEVLRRL
jgi:HAD superfamily hydrolase (TIGR01509 family)